MREGMNGAQKSNEVNKDERNRTVTRKKEQLVIFISYLHSPSHLPSCPPVYFLFSFPSCGHMISLRAYTLFR